jgi:competence protein ComFC
MNIQQSLSDTSWKAADWLFPPVCVGCGDPGEAICEVCRLSITRIPDQHCRLCYRPLRLGGVCPSCINHPPNFDQIYCFAAYSGLMRKAIRHLKYDRDLGMGRLLSKFIVPDLLDLFDDIDLVIPMPLSAERMRTRGYNQSEAITKHLVNLTGWKHSPKALRKIRNTESQVHLSVVERLANLDGAFQAETDLVRGKRVLLLDDVFTTGATMRQASKALKTAGAMSVVSVAIARTLLNHE